MSESEWVGWRLVLVLRDDRLELDIGSGGVENPATACGTPGSASEKDGASSNNNRSGKGLGGFFRGILHNRGRPGGDAKVVLGEPREITRQININRRRQRRAWSRTP